MKLFLFMITVVNAIDTVSTVWLGRRIGWQYEGNVFLRWHFERLGVWPAGIVKIGGGLVLAALLWIACREAAKLWWSKVRWIPWLLLLVFAFVAFFNVGGVIALWAPNGLPTWTTQAIFVNGKTALSLCSFGDHLYVGLGCCDSPIYRTSDGKTWTRAVGLGDGNVNDLHAHSGYLYAGTQTKIWRTLNGTDWEEDFVHPEEKSFYRFASHVGRIYVSNGSGIYRRGTDGWVLEYGYPGGGVMWGMLSDGGDLYVTTQNDGNILKGTGRGTPLDWTVDYDPPEEPRLALNLVKVGDVIYAGSREMGPGLAGGNGRVYKKEDGVWSLDRTFDEEQVISFMAVGGVLYAGAGIATKGTGQDANIYKKEDGAWSLDFESGQEKVFTFCVWKGDLYAGTTNEATIFILKGGGK